MALFPAALIIAPYIIPYVGALSGEDADAMATAMCRVFDDKILRAAVKFDWRASPGIECRRGAAAASVS